MKKTLFGLLGVAVLAFIAMQVAQIKPLAERTRHPKRIEAVSVMKEKKEYKANSGKIEITPESAAASAISSLRASGQLDLDTSKVKEVDPAEDEAVKEPTVNQ